MDTLSSILSTFRLQVDIVHNAQYCGDWAVDTSGTRSVSFHIVTHGQCFVSADSLGDAVALKTGDLVLFPQDQKHLLQSRLDCAVPVNQQLSIDYQEGVAANAVGLLCGHFRFAHAASNPLLDVLPEVIVKHRQALTERCPIGHLLGLIESESLNGLPGSQVAINRLTESLFVLIVREYFAEDKESPGLAAALADKRIRKVLDAMHSQPEQRWSLDSLAGVASMSRSAFASLFKALLNESAIDYLTRWRMQNAWLWLQEEGATVYNVALRCGYESDAAFAKAFKRELGVGPGTVRKLNNSRGGVH